MKKIKYLLLLLAVAVSFSSCVVHERVMQPYRYRAYRTPGHYEYGHYHNRHRDHGYNH